MYMTPSADGPGHDIDRENEIVSELKKRKKSLPAISALTEEMAKTELVELNEMINYHDSLYYSSLEGHEQGYDGLMATESGGPAISDRAYDKLVSRADAISGRFKHLHELVDKFNRIGYNRSNKFDPFRHLGGNMLSLDNAFSEEQIRNFVERCATKLRGNARSNDDIPFDFVVEPKIDGLSLALHYVDGVLTGAGTRGDGIVGENVTANVQFIGDIPKRLSRNVSIEVRGEVYITKEDFAALNKERIVQNATKFSTTRNAAAGGLRQIDPQLTAGRKLRFFAYSLFDIIQTTDKGRDGEGFTSVCRADQMATLEELQQLGFEIASPVKKCTSVEDTIRQCMDLEKDRSAMRYDVDGAVLKVDSLAMQNRIGELSRFPGWAIAYKFKAEERTTILNAIEVQVGRTGVLTPVAILEPVEVGGVIIERATLHNEAEVRRLSLSPGATVTVIRAGDVIPKVIGRVDDFNANGKEVEASVFSLPAACPVCGSPTEKDGDILVRCTGTTVCSAQAVSQISHFCSRDAADIDGLGPARIEELHQLGMLRSIADIYSLRKADLGEDISNPSEHSSLRDRKGWGDKSVNNLLAAIDSRKKLSFDRFLYGLGIRHIGLGSARDIAKEFGDFKEFWEYIKDVSNRIVIETDKGDKTPCARLYDIPGIGPKIVDSLLLFASTPASRTLVDDLLGDVDIMSISSTETNTEGATDLSGETFIFSGKLKQLSRSEAARLCRSLGAKVSTSFTNEITTLVNGGDGSRESSKLKMARASGKVKVIDEESFLKLID